VRNGNRSKSLYIGVTVKRSHYLEANMRKSLMAGIFVVVVLSIAPLALSQIQNVKSTGGQLQGVVADGVASFKGIPFAAPPVGDLR